MTTSNQSPVVQRRRLRFELRHERDQAGLTQEQVAAEMDWSLSKVIRIEKGDVSISTNDMRALLSLYGVTDRARVHEMIELARTSRQKAWWHPYREQLGSPFLRLLSYEAEATRIIYATGSMIPGLLQTEDYARALMSTGPTQTDEDQIDRFVEIRMERQRETFERRTPPAKVEAIMDEAALRRIVGDRQVMAEQCDHLIRMVEQYGVSLRIITFEAGAHPGMMSAFTLLQFDDQVTDDVVYVDALTGILWFRDIPDETDEYWEALGQLQRLALTTERSIDVVRKIREELTAEA